MATSESLHPVRPEAEEIEILPLEPGDHLDQPTFHARYGAMPEHIKAELIGGVVIMPSPLKRPHGRYHFLLNIWLGAYWVATPGTDPGDNVTVILGDDSEPQPDALLTIIGGQTHENEDEYLVGPPEWVGEIASSSASYDLHSKKREYERQGVQEYAVFVIRQKRVAWFVRENDRLVERPPDADGILRSRIFPGLWLDPDAFFRRDAARLQDVLNAGLQAEEHRAFVQRLAEPPQ